MVLGRSMERLSSRFISEIHSAFSFLYFESKYWHAQKKGAKATVMLFCTRRSILHTFTPFSSFSFSFVYSHMAKTNINIGTTDNESQQDTFLYYGKAAENMIPITTTPNNHSTALNLPCYQSKQSSALYGDRMYRQSIIEPLWEDKLSDIEEHRDTATMTTPPPADSWYAILFKTPLVPVSRGKHWHIVFSYTMTFLMIAIMSGEFMMNHELSGKNGPRWYIEQNIDKIN